MMVLRTDEPLAVSTIDAIHRGDVEALRRLLAEHPGLATAQLGDPTCGESRTLLHIATDWPGHFRNGPAIVAAVVEAGADVNARFTGRHTETPLQWAASSDDVEVLDALLDLGADIEAPGAVIGGGTALADAVTFGQWKAARRLIERGARASLPRRSGCSIASSLASPAALARSPPRSTGPSGMHVTAASADRRSTCSAAAPT